MRSGHFIAPHDKLVVTLVGEEDGRPLWRLEKPLAFLSDSLGLIQVPPGFITDFSSVPRLPFMYLLFGNTATRPGVVHDWLYEKGLIRDRKITREEADTVWNEASDADDQPTYRSRSMWAGIRAGGWVAWNRHRKRNGLKPRFPGGPK